MRNLLLSILVLANALASAQTIDLGTGIAITGKVIPFDSTKHTITRCAILDWQPKPICLIDGRPFFGHDFDITAPRMELASLKVSIAGKDVELDVTGMFNPNGYAQLRSDQFKIKQSDGINAVEIIGLFSDGAGTYVAAWKAMAGGSIRTVISASENEVVHWWHQVPYPQPSKR